MKAIYISPSMEVVKIGTSALLQPVSGLGLGEGGQAGTNIDPQ